MNDQEARRLVAQGWMDKAELALAAARRDYAAGDMALAVNRIYYACFYAASAVLLNEGHQFSKHAGVRAAVHQHLVNTKRLSMQWGKFYDQAFEDRQEADYQALTVFESPRVQSRMDQAAAFLVEMQHLLKGI
ncbi:MAG: HEPN domain-containing protein [Phycisphaerae bacterium]|nr:HEPN domain-containing protein [Phycisphaerae bacterium]